MSWISSFTVLFIISSFGEGLCQMAGRNPMEIFGPKEVQVVSIEGKSTVYYELKLTNLLEKVMNIDKVQVMLPADSSVLFSISGDDLLKRLAPLGFKSNNKQHLNAAQSCVLYLEFSMPETVGSVYHSVAYSVVEGTASGQGNIVNGSLTHLNHAEPVVLGPPLEGGPWIAVYHPSWERGHRRVIYTKNNKARIPGRFAIDFIKVDTEGGFAHHNADSIANWYGYALPVLAVADGVVVASRDDFTESKTLSGHPKYSADQATGNYVAIELTGGQFVFYEHLKPGSVKVKEGQKVSKGQQIGALGFTGQTTGPHLHFHVADQNSPLGAEGIPFVFEQFQFIGYYNDSQNLGQEKWTPSHPRLVLKERPLPNAVIQFQFD